jgi:peptide/nickel transport system substrate-binding protein
MDRLADAMLTETDLAKRDALIADAWKLAKDDVVYLPIHHQVITWGMSQKLVGSRPGPW